MQTFVVFEKEALLVNGTVLARIQQAGNAREAVCKVAEAVGSGDYVSIPVPEATPYWLVTSETRLVVRP